MIIILKISPKAYKRAESYTNVVGLWEGKEDCWMYAELGEEFEYISRPKDDPNTDFRIFRGCTVSIAESEEDLKAGIVATTLLNQTVKIYY